LYFIFETVYFMRKHCVFVTKLECDCGINPLGSLSPERDERRTQTLPCHLFLLFHIPAGICNRSKCQTDPVDDAKRLISVLHQLMDGQRGIVRLYNSV